MGRIFCSLLPNCVSLPRWQRDMVQQCTRSPAREGWVAAFFVPAPQSPGGHFFNCHYNSSITHECLDSGWGPLRWWIDAFLGAIPQSASASHLFNCQSNSVEEVIGIRIRWVKSALGGVFSSLALPGDALLPSWWPEPATIYLGVTSSTNIT